MPVANINGQKIHFQDTGGAGDPIILAHGFLMDCSMFDAQVAVLTKAGYRVITWDERGFGQTEFDGQPFSYWDSARDCLALADHLGIGHAIFGGMSQGGFLSLRLALLSPERVRALLLFDTGAHVDPPEVIEGFQQMIDTWAAVGPVDELADGVANMIIADPDHNTIWIDKWRKRDKSLIIEPGRCLMTRDSLVERLGEITAPAMIVHGTADTAIGPDHAEELRDGLGGPVKFAWIEGAAHAANVTHSAAVNTVMLEFLQEHAPVRG